MEEEQPMEMTPVTWDEIQEKYLKFNEGDSYEIVSINRQLYKTVKNFGKEDQEKIEFKTDVIELDGVELKEPMVFTTVSLPLQLALKKVLGKTEDDVAVRLRITRTGTGNKTVYTVKAIWYGSTKI